MRSRKTTTSKSSGLLMLAAGAAGAAVMLRQTVRSRRRINLRGRVVLITGGSRGLGLDLARECAKRGARIALIARDESELARAADELRTRYRADVFFRPGDVTVQAIAESVVRSVFGHFGTIDVLINNAGTITVAPMQEMDQLDYDQAVALHLWAPIYTTHAVLPIMRGRRDGRIVNITSIGGKLPAPHLLPYTASKFALVGFSQGLRVELAKDNVFVTTVVPGLFRSGSPRNAYFKGRNEEEYAWFATADVLPGLSMSPRRLARQIVNALEVGQSELISPWIASVQARFAGLFPGLTTEIIAMIDRFLPRGGGVGRVRQRGWQSESSRVPAFARERLRSSAQDHNQL